MDKEDVLHIDHGIVLGHEMGWKNDTCSNIDGPKGYHTKWRKSERERQIPYSITYMWNLKYDTNELTNKIETQTERTDLSLPRGWGGMEWESGISRCKLLYIEWINNKVLLYWELYGVSYDKL